MADVSTDPLVPVYRKYEGKDGKDSTFPRGWPKNPFKETRASADVMALSQALTRGFRYPAYMTAHAVPKGLRRPTKDLLGNEKCLEYVGGSIEMQLFLVDVDGPAHSEPASSALDTTESPQGLSMDAWWEQELPKLEKLLEDHPGLFIYRSRGGYRIVGRLVPTIHLSSMAGGVHWTRRYVSWVNYLNRKYEIRTHGKDTADKLGEWNRLQRLPHDSRDFATPDQLETIGDPKNVGIWNPKILPEDMPPEPTQKLARIENEQNVGALLLELVQARGLRCVASTANEYDICCPRWTMHSPNEAGLKDYEGKTRLYTAQGKLGGIKCFSDGCTAEHQKPGDWIDEFSWIEKLHARRALGRSTLGDPRPITYNTLKVMDVNYNVISILQQGKDDSKPDKTIQQCIQQCTCEMLRRSIQPESILYVLTNEEYEISKHVLEQVDPGWYVEETLARALEATAEKTEIINIKESAAVVVDLIKSTQENFALFYSFETRDKDVAFSDDDVDLGRMAVTCFGRDRCRFIEGQGSWVIHNGHRWVPGEDGRIRTLLVELAHCLESESRKVSAGLKGAARKILVESHIKRHPWLTEDDTADLDKSLKEEADRIRCMAKKLKQKAGLNAVLTMVADALTILPDDLDQNPDQVIFLNGTWNAKSNEFSRNVATGFPTRACDIEWAEPTDEARKRWQDYLATLGFDEATLGFLQRSFGYALLGRGGEKRFWWFRGETDTGKTTIIELAANCLGTYVEPTPTELWLAKGGSRPGHTDDLAALRGCRLVTADEFPKISRFDDGLVKRCTSGGSPLRVSQKGKTGFEFVPRFSMFFASNYDPQIAEDDAALMRRLTALTFKNPITAKNTKFVSDFLGQDGQKLAILEWMMAGAREYLANGLSKEPQQVKQSRVDFSAGQVSVEDQLMELLRKEPGQRVSVTMVMSRLAELQNRTRQRCQYNQAQVRKTIIERLGAKADETNGVKSFIGVALRRDQFASTQSDPSAEPDPDYVPGDEMGFTAPGF